MIGIEKFTKGLIWGVGWECIDRTVLELTPNNGQ